MRVIRFVCSWRACAGGRQLECDPRAQPGVRAHGKKHTGRRTLKSFHPGVYTCAGDSSALIVLSSSGEKAAANGETRGACTAKRRGACAMNAVPGARARTSRIIRISLVGRRTRASFVLWLVWLSPLTPAGGPDGICLRISYLIQCCNHTVVMLFLLYLVYIQLANHVIKRFRCRTLESLRPRDVRL